MAGPKRDPISVPRLTLDLTYQALDDAITEIEAFEVDAKWYTASQKMIDRIENSMKAIKELLK